MGESAGCTGSAPGLTPIREFPRQSRCTIALEYLRIPVLSFWSELKRRNVVRVGVAYLAGTWLTLQVADIVLPNLDAPTWIIIALIYSAAIGFPCALIVAS